MSKLLKNYSIMLSVAALALFAGQASAAGIKAKMTSEAEYMCEDKTQVHVSYYKLNDDSLNFIKIMVGKAQYTLPQVVSASGTRYTDLDKMEWSTKGKSGMLNRDASNQNAPSTNCSEVAKK